MDTFNSHHGGAAGGHSFASADVGAPIGAAAVVQPTDTNAAMDSATSSGVIGQPLRACIAQSLQLFAPSLAAGQRAHVLAQNVSHSGLDPSQVKRLQLAHEDSQLAELVFFSHRGFLDVSTAGDLQGLLASGTRVLAFDVTHEEPRSAVLDSIETFQGFIERYAPSATTPKPAVHSESREPAAASTPRVQLDACELMEVALRTILDGLRRNPPVHPTQAMREVGTDYRTYKSVVERLRADELMGVPADESTSKFAVQRKLRAEILKIRSPAGLSNADHAAESLVRLELLQKVLDACEKNPQTNVHELLVRQDGLAHVRDVLYARLYADLRHGVPSRAMYPVTHEELRLRERIARIRTDAMAQAAQPLANPLP